MGLTTGMSWIGGKGSVCRKKLFNVGGRLKYLSSSGELQEITVERRTAADKNAIIGRAEQVTKGIDYHVAHRNCEHFACYVTGVVVRSEQSVTHLVPDHEPFSTTPLITNLGQLRDALLRCRYCGPCALTRHDFEGTTLVSKLEEGFFTYHLAHPLGGQHLYVTRVAKSEGVDTSYDAVVLAQYGAFFGRGEMLAIIRQLQGA